MIVKESVIKRINAFINRDTNDCILYPVLNKEGYGQMQSYLEGKKLHGYINADVIGFCPRLNECVYICVNLELEYIKSNCFTKSY